MKTSCLDRTGIARTREPRPWTFRDVLDYTPRRPDAPSGGGLVNDRPRTAISRRGLTLEAVAEHARVDPKTVQRLIAGRVPHGRHRWTVAAPLQADADYLWP